METSTFEITTLDPQVTVVFWEICVCMHVSVTRQVESSPGLQNSLLLEYIGFIAEKALLKEKGLRTLLPLHHSCLYSLC